MAQDIGLHNLKPKPGSRHRKKRVGRGEGSGMGKTSGRGEKGAGARSGAKSRVNFEGGQMPIHMRLRKLRGPHMKKSMPFEQFGRTKTQPVNLKDLEARFDAGAEVTPETLKAKGLATRKDVPVKILGQGELTKKLAVMAHYASATAREKIEAAGGTVELLVEPKKKKTGPKPQAEAPPKAKGKGKGKAEPKAETDPAGPAPEDLADQEEVNEEIASDAEIQPSEEE
jgi:large subunit ribosomal protein L15